VPGPTVDLQSLRASRKAIVSCAASYGACSIRVFGSVARGETSRASDIDLLVEMEQRRSLLDLVGLWQDLSDLLGGNEDPRRCLLPVDRVICKRYSPLIAFHFP
jgi:uncharacterized protein